MDIRIVDEPSLIETISVIVSLVSVVVLTVAAVVAYFVQRSRFLKEVEPHIALESIEASLHNDNDDPRLVGRMSLKNSGGHDAYLRMSNGRFAILPPGPGELGTVELIERQWPAYPEQDSRFFRILPQLVRDIAIVFELETPLEQLAGYRLQLDIEFEFESGRQALLIFLFKSVVKKNYSLNVSLVSDWPTERMAVEYPWFA